MLSTELSIVAVGALVFLSHVFVSVFEKTRIPDVLLLTLIGFLIGPIFGLVSPADFGVVGKFLTKITLIILLFEGGLELELSTLKKNALGSLALTVLAYVVSMAAIWGVLRLFSGMDSRMIVFYSALLAGPAPAVVMPLLKKLSATENMKTILSLESTIGESLCILVSLAILDGIVQNTQLISISFGLHLALSFLGAIVLGSAAGFFWSVYLGRLRKLQNSLFLTLAFVFVLYGLAELLQVSGPIAALSFGFAMGNIRTLVLKYLPEKPDIDLKAHTTSEIRFFGEITFLLKIFFFVFLGISIELEKWHMALLAFILTIALLGARVISVFFVQKLISSNEKDRFISGCMFPRGLAAAILAAAPATFGIVDSSDLSLAVDYTIVLSILISSIFLFIVERRLMNKNQPDGTSEISDPKLSPSS